MNLRTSPITYTLNRNFMTNQVFLSQENHRFFTVDQFSVYFFQIYIRSADYEFKLKRFWSITNEYVIFTTQPVQRVCSFASLWIWCLMKFTSYLVENGSWLFQRSFSEFFLHKFWLWSNVDQIFGMWIIQTRTNKHISDLMNENIDGRHVNFKNSAKLQRFQ